MQSEQIPFIPYDKRKDLQPKLEVKTPHLPFAKGLAGGPLAVFTMSNVGYGREIPELMQRMDLKVSHMTWDRTYGQNTWGFGDFYGKRGHAAPDPYAANRGAVGFRLAPSPVLCPGLFMLPMRPPFAAHPAEGGHAAGGGDGLGI